MRRNAAVVCAFLWLAVPSASFALTEEEVSKQLKCQCGCGYPDLHSCSCGEWAVPAKNEIRARITRGEDLQTILKYFIDRHGETVLTTPVQEGFNRAEWIVPSVLILVAGGLLSVALLRWKKRNDPGAPPQEFDETPGTRPDEALLERLHDEIYGSKED
mgnify:CR=1 FL=1